MTFEEMEKSLAGIEDSLKGLRDNQEVQGVMLWRMENNLDRLEAAVEQLAHGMTLLQSAMKGLIGTVEGLTETVEVHEKQHAEDREQMRVMQAAMTALFERMDRFIRGLESDGHKTGGET